MNPNNSEESEVALEEEIEEYIKEPPLFKVVLLNDDYTSMEFVIGILVDIFDHPIDKAVEIMYAVHQKGRGVCGVYTYEIAETKAMHVHLRAKENGYPLRAVIEEE